MTLDELLTPYRTETTESAAVVIGDEEAIRVLAAFRNVEHEWKMPRGKPPDGMTKRWRWLTSTWKVDVDELAAACGMGVETVERKVDMLVMNRLVYPDGTISKAAALALQAHVSKQLGVKPGRQRPQGIEPPARKDSTS